MDDQEQQHGLRDYLLGPQMNQTARDYKILRNRAYITGYGGIGQKSGQDWREELHGRSDFRTIVQPTKLTSNVWHELFKWR